MEKLIKIISGLLFSAAFLLLMVIHVNVDKNEISFGGEELCAQTGTCEWSPGDNCYVNGVKDPNRKWVSGDVIEIQ